MMVPLFALSLMPGAPTLRAPLAAPGFGGVTGQVPVTLWTAT